jgi:hypothetical protein
MKNRIKVIALLLIAAGSLNSCKKKDEPTPAPPVPAANSITIGDWRVAEFEINGVDHSESFGAYTFVFSRNGTAVVKGAGGNENGLWSLNNLDQKSFYKLYFGEAEPFRFLNNEHWYLVKQTDGSLELEGKTATDGTENLTFQKK